LIRIAQECFRIIEPLQRDGMARSESCLEAVTKTARRLQQRRPRAPIGPDCFWISARCCDRLISNRTIRLRARLTSPSTTRPQFSLVHPSPPVGQVRTRTLTVPRYQSPDSGAACRNCRFHHAECNFKPPKAPGRRAPSSE